MVHRHPHRHAGGYILSVPNFLKKCADRDGKREKDLVNNIQARGYIRAGTKNIRNAYANDHRVLQGKELPLSKRINGFADVGVEHPCHQIVEKKQQAHMEQRKLKFLHQ